MNENSDKKVRNLQSQNKRIERRSSQEMVCVAILMSLGYKVEFKRPRSSKKARPFVLINKILENGLFRDNEEAKLQKLLNLRQALLDPQWGKLQFMSKNLH